MKITLIVIMVLVCISLVFPCSAQNMSISHYGIGSLQTVQLYDGNGTLLGTFNTSTNGIELPTGDFVLGIKPASSDPLTDPGQWMTDALAWITTNITAIILVMFLIGLLFWRR
jgi:hypothetical protein